MLLVDGMFLSLLERGDVHGHAAIAPEFRRGRAVKTVLVGAVERRRASAARDALSAAPVRVLCGKLGGQPDNPAVAHTDEPASGDAGRD